MSPLQYADALLYLGPPSALTVVDPQPGSAERAYVTEVDRRSLIEWGDLRGRTLLAPAAP